MKFLEILWVVGIVLSIAALFTIAPAEIALHGFVISIAIFSLVWIGIAKKNLSRGSSLGTFSAILFSSICFFLITSIVQLVMKIFVVPILIWPTYVSMSAAYALLVVSSYKLMRIGKEFGFAPATGKIRKVMEEKLKDKLTAYEAEREKLKEKHKSKSKRVRSK